jgi:hypothetical protein
MFKSILITIIIAQVTAIILKITGIFTWHWALITLPLWFTIIAIIAILILFYNMHIPNLMDEPIPDLDDDYQKMMENP